MKEYWIKRHSEQGESYVAHRQLNNFVQQKFKFMFEAIKNLDKDFEKGLDFGCGIGRFQEYLTTKCKSVYAIDVIPDCIQFMREKYPSTQSFLLETPQLKYPVSFPYKNEEINCSITKHPFPFQNNTFDLIWSVTALQHIVHKNYFEYICSELRRVARKDATFFLIENHHDSAGHVMKRSPEEYAKALDVKMESYPISVDKQDSHWVMVGKTT